MNKKIQLHGKTVNVHISKAAKKAVDSAPKPLVAEIHLIFGCMVAKRVWIKEQIDHDVVPVIAKLSVRFKTVTYAKTCSFDEIDKGAEHSDFPLVAEKRAFIPTWVSIDYRGGKWFGTFGYLTKLSKAVIPSNALEYKLSKA